ncbi:MAG: DNA mismatch repair endonuclease MutL [Gemmatimonadota bacterium]
MKGRVRVLSDGVVNQIAAGEVVERPSSVVKELVDNALDAGARRIEITLAAAGRDRIAVADDGCGMVPEDAWLAFERHATSKIVAADDLRRITTLGFRGEALPSIAAVSRLVLETAPAGGGPGVRIRLDGGARGGPEPIARAPGTTVDVRQLFYNTPARRKFLRTHATEQAVIVQRIVEQALARTDVAWRAAHGPREILELSPAGTLIERLVGLFDLAYVETLLPIQGGAEGMAVHGFVQRAAAAGAGRRRQYTFVNGRPVEAPDLLRAFWRGYRSTLPAGARPDGYLFLELDPATVDVNVHPAKREVRFTDSAAVAGAVEDAVRQALGAGPVAARPWRAPSTPRPIAASRTTAAGGRVAEPGPAEPGQFALFFSGRRAAPNGAAAAAAVPDAEAPSGPLPLDPAAPGLWQLHQRFILAQTASGLVVIDQHSAHERVLYEQVIGELRAGARAAQRLLFPLVLHLTPAQYAAWEVYATLIERLGFEAEPFGGQTIAVAAVPAFRHAFDPEAALVGLLDDLGEPGGGSADMNQHERVARLFACKAAIKAGARLAPDEMIELIDRLFATTLPYDDVHGRPAILQIGLDELHRHFGRH